MEIPCRKEVKRKYNKSRVIWFFRQMTVLLLFLAIVNLFQQRCWFQMMSMP